MNYKLIATDMGELVKWDIPVNVINRTGNAVFSFQREEFPKESITSERARLVYDWIMTLAKRSMRNDERNAQLAQFCHRIAGSEQKGKVDEILSNAGVLLSKVNEPDSTVFYDRHFHAEIRKHSRKLFLDGHYFHAVFEAAKAYNKSVKVKSEESDDGQPLMLKVWGPDKGVLKITACVSQTDKDVQNGVMFLSAGLMSAIRNPTAHEPAVDWPISREDCLDVLSFISFSFRKLDDAVFFKSSV